MKYVIVGAESSGLTIAERIANQLNEEVLIIEKEIISAEIFMISTEDGILIQKTDLISSIPMKNRLRILVRVY